MEIITNEANSTGIVLLLCAKMAFHTERLLIVLTEINPSWCAAMRHGLGRVRNATEEELEGEEEQIRCRIVSLDLWQQETDSPVASSNVAL